MQIEYLQIVIPTHEPHFKRNAIFLEYFYKHCLDKENVEITFIVYEHEKDKFYKCIEEAYKERINLYTDDLKIKVYTLKELVKEFFNEDINERQLKVKIGKFNMQCMKKLLGLYKVGNPYALLFDSETLVIRDFKLRDLFDRYFFKDKHIFYTDNTDTFNAVLKQITEDCTEIIGEKKGLPYYFLEAYNWFFDKRILDDLFTYIEGKKNSNLFRLMTEKYKIIFETHLYYSFIYHNNDKYNYNFVCINNELEAIMGKEEFEKYRINKDLPTCFEFHMKVMNTPFMVATFNKFYEKWNLNFCKYGILNESQYSDYQKKFIEETSEIIFLCTLFCVPALSLKSDTVDEVLR